MTDDAASRDAKIQAIVDAYKGRRDSGEQVSDEALIAANPELMPELGEELRKLRLIAAARERAAQPITDDAITQSHQPSDALSSKESDVLMADSGSGRLEVRCPSCHEPTEVAVDTLLTDLTCSSCGSHFSLVDQSKATRMAPSLTKLGRFELIERLGVGGFGSVWKARDKELDRTVAIKIPRAGGMTGEEQEKFFREARAAAQLRHPSIVSVHEVGRDGDSVYIVSDFVRGVTLGDWLTGQLLTSHEAAELCAEIAAALHHAHEHGVVHRDMKPANIMIDGDGQPHVMDFGLARREVGEVTVTLDGQVLGTPAYMSPEQAAGEAHTADRRSDVYSLGVILFQLLTGELPFRGNARMLMHQVINDEPPSPRKLNSNVSKDLETITLKCMEKDPVNRYQTIGELSDELRRYLAGEPILARPITGIERGLRWSRRNPQVAILGGLLLSTLIVGATIALMLAVQAKRSAAQSREERDRAEESLTIARETIDKYVRGQYDKYEVAATALPIYERLAKQKPDDAALRSGRAELLSTLAIFYHQVVNLAEARSKLEQALSIWSKLSIEAPNVSEHQLSLSKIHKQLGLLFRDMNDEPSAREQFITALDISTKLAAKYSDDHDRDTRSKYQKVLAGTHNQYALFLALGGDNVAAKEQHEKALAIYTQFADEEGISLSRRLIVLLKGDGPFDAATQARELKQSIDPAYVRPQAWVGGDFYQRIQPDPRIKFH